MESPKWATYTCQLHNTLINYQNISSALMLLFWSSISKYRLQPTRDKINALSIKLSGAHKTQQTNVAMATHLKYQFSSKICNHKINNALIYIYIYNKNYQINY